MYDIFYSSYHHRKSVDGNVQSQFIGSYSDYAKIIGLYRMIYLYFKSFLKQTFWFLFTQTDLVISRYRTEAVLICLCFDAVNNSLSIYRHIKAEFQRKLAAFNVCSVYVCFDRVKKTRSPIWTALFLNQATMFIMKKIDDDKVIRISVNAPEV